MNVILEAQLVNAARKTINGADSAHDFEHAMRVTCNVQIISAEEGGDLDVLIPSALFHDAVIYPKNDPRSPLAPYESAALVRTLLPTLAGFPKHKIEFVARAIELCSFDKTGDPPDLETAILRDADKLEATGIVSIMRTFASTGQMGRAFYDPEDPFCEDREPDATRFGLDLFYTRLLIAHERMYTDTARRMAQERTVFLNAFLEELRRDLGWPIRSCVAAQARAL